MIEEASSSSVDDARMCWICMVGIGCLPATNIPASR